MRYYGGKSKLLDFINNVVTKTGVDQGSIFLDLFAGTTVVSKFFKQKDFTVYTNDFLEFSYALARTYIDNNDYPPFKDLQNIIHLNNNPLESIHNIIYQLNKLPPLKGFIYKNYCPGGTINLNSPRMYFTDENGMKIDAIRTKIQEWKDNNFINENEFYILLTSLLEAIPYVANIAGNYAAYLKYWDPRAIKPLNLNIPIIPKSRRNNKAFKKDANELIKKIYSNILYLDPPYNTRQYVSNYFLLELIAEGWFNEQEPKIYGKTGIRVYNKKKSSFSQKETVLNAFKDLIKHAKTEYILLSYNDEGLMSEEEIISILSTRGNVKIFKKQHRRYRSINQNKLDKKIVFETLYFVKVSKE